MSEHLDDPDPTRLWVMPMADLDDAINDLRRAKTAALVAHAVLNHASTDALAADIDVDECTERVNSLIGALSDPAGAAQPS